MQKGFQVMVKWLLAWLNKVSGVFKVFWSKPFVNNSIYRRNYNGNNRTTTNTEKIKSS